MKLLFSKFILPTIVICFGSLLTSVGQQPDITLHIGDPAPPFKYSRWLKGEPINSFDEDHIYVVEFWATWCGPCRTAMPHLTKLQKKYEGSITIIGVDIWEDAKQGKPHDSFIPLVEKFVNENSSKMGYSVFIDNNEQFMGNNWMKASGEQGIPATFIIKNRKIVWIGNPMALDSLLPKIIAGSYSVGEQKMARENELARTNDELNAWLMVSNPIEEAYKAKQYKKSLELIEKAIPEHREYSHLLKSRKFRVLLHHFGTRQAISFGNQWIKEEKEGAGVIQSVVSAEQNLPKEVYLWAARANDHGEQMEPYNYHRLAVVYAMGGDFKNAVRLEEKAVTSAEKILHGEKMVGVITSGMLEGYRETLAAYKNGKMGRKDVK